MKTVTNSFETLKVERFEDHLLVVTLNRPEIRKCDEHANGPHLWSSLRRPQDIRSIVITGAGDKIFSAGGQYQRTQRNDRSAMACPHPLFELAHHGAPELQVPVIAA